MIEIEAVIGIGSWKRIKHLRVNRPLEQIVITRIKALDRMSAAEDNKTTCLVSRTQSHHPKRSAAYSRTGGTISARCV
jgi:hypothetical protein